MDGPALKDSSAAERRSIWTNYAVLFYTVIAFAAVLFVPALWGYFGLTVPAAPVFIVVLPALVLWFVALTAAYRLRLLDRVLRVDELLAPDGRLSGPTL